MLNLYNKIWGSKAELGLRKVYQFLIFLSGLAILLAMMATVLLRYVFKMDLYGIDEVILAVVFWFYFFGGINGSFEDSQVRADVVGTLFKNNLKLQHYLRIVTRIIEIIAIIFLIVMSISLLITNFQRMPVTTGLKIPYVIPQMGVALGFILMLFYSVGHLVKQLGTSPEEEVSELDL